MTEVHKVAVIVRTKNRPLFLKRAIFESIIPQTFQDYRVYIINDGGDLEDIKKIENSIPADFSAKFVFVHLPFSLGRGGALAAGISHTSEKYLHIHDDSDSLESDFYEKTVAYLEEDTKEIFSGVKTSNYDVYEHVENNNIINEFKSNEFGVEIEPIKDYIQLLSHMTIVVPITLLFRRRCIIDVGTSDARKNFGEDKDLFIRLMQWGEIGVIKDLLCSYHHNNKGKNNPEERKNSYDQIIMERNNIIREALNTGNMAKLFQVNVWRNFNLEQGQYAPVYEQIRILKESCDAVTKSIRSFLD